METLGDLSNWAARRLARSLLRKTRLQQILATDLDFEQISVQLAKGSLELKGFLLDTKYLNEQLANDVYEIESGLVGKISISLFDLHIVVEDVTVNVIQREVEQSAPANLLSRARQPGFNASQPSYNNNEAQEAAVTGVAEGIQLVSDLVQRLFKIQVEGRRIEVEMKLAQGQLLTIKLDNVAMQDAQGVEHELLYTACDVAKAYSFSGLAVKLTASDDPTSEVLASISWEATGCSGKIAVGWAVDELNLNALASFDGVCVWIQPAAASVISNLLETFKRARTKPEPSKDMPASDHTLSRSLVVADAVSQSNILRALTLPDGQRLLEEELARMPGAHGGEQDVDEFFDALASYSGTDYMSQSFFSTASTVFGEARSRPLSPNGESFLPLEENSRQFAANEMPSPSVQVQVEVAALELWLACRSESIGSEDPWYMRLNMQGILLRQELSSTWTASLKSIDISEYTPIEANKSKLHDIGQFEALYEKFATHCDLPSFSSCFSEKIAFADTIRRLELLKLVDRNFWCPPDNYEMSPIIACVAAGHPALSMIVKKSRVTGALAASLLLLKVHSCLNAPMLTRMEGLVSSFATGFCSRTASEVQEQQAVSLDLTVHLSMLTLCFFAPNTAIALQVLSGVTIDELSSLINQRGSHWNQAVCPPFIKVQRELDDTHCRVYANRAQIYNMVIDSGGLIEIVDGGYAEAFSISSVLNVCRTLQTLSEDLPENIAPLIDQSKHLPCVDDTTGMGKSVSIAGATVKATEITIAGDLQVNVSPTLLSSVIEIARSFSVFSRSPTNSGAFKVHIADLKLQFLGPLSLVCRDIQLMHILDDTNSSFATGSIGSLCLHGGSEWHYISTFSSEAMAIAFAISDSCRSGSDAAIKKHLILRVDGIILAEDFLCEKPVWSEFDYIKSIAMQTPGNTTAQSLAVHISGKQLLILQIPSSEHQVAAAVYVQDFCVAAPEPADVCAHIDGASIYLRESGLAHTGLQSAFSVPTWLQEKGYLLIASEEQMHFKRWFSTNPLLKAEMISLRTRSLHLNMGKDSAALIKKLSELVVRRRHTGEADEDFAEMASDAVEEALGLDIGGPDEQHAPLNGAWYADQGLGVEDTEQSLGPGELRQHSFPTREAIVNGGGASLFPYVYFSDYVRNSTARSEIDAVYERMITIGLDNVTLVVIGTSSLGGDILEGSLQLKVENCEAAWRQYDGVNILHDCECRRNELVLRASCSPGSALVRLDQYLLHFLLSFSQDFTNPINLDSWQTLEEEEVEEEGIGQEEDDISENGGSVYIQRCHIAGFSLTVSYIPAYVDMGALRKGSYMEFLNVLPELKASDLWLRNLEICGEESFSSLGAVAATRWMQEILAFQKHRFSILLSGGQSVPIGAIGKTLTDFAAQPATHSKETFEQLQKAAIAFLQLMANEGREVGVTVAGAWKSRR
ncbi:hypothetical protein Ndes2526B_g07926 [Nannochloris sp. 'desiccata']